VPFAADLVSLGVGGFGKLVEGLARTAADGAAEVGKTTVFLRAGRLLMRSNHLAGFLFALADRSPFAKIVIRGFGFGDELRDAFSAATAARSALEKVIEESEPGGMMTLLMMARGPAEDLAKLDVIQDVVPGVLRIEVARTVARALAGVDGAVRWGVFGGSAGFTLHALLSPG
jgi:hypothetical protein